MQTVVTLRDGSEVRFHGACYAVNDGALEIFDVTKECLHTAPKKRLSKKPSATYGVDEWAGVTHEWDHDHEAKAAEERFE